MNENKLDKIERLIQVKKIDEAQLELSKLEPEFFKNAEYLYLRSKIFYINELYYIALDTLLIALEFEKKDKIYNLIAKIYDILGNRDLSNKILKFFLIVFPPNFAFLSLFLNLITIPSFYYRSGI